MVQELDCQLHQLPNCRQRLNGASQRLRNSTIVAANWKPNSLRSTEKSHNTAGSGRAADQADQKVSGGQADQSAAVARRSPAVGPVPLAAVRGTK